MSQDAPTQRWKDYLLAVHVGAGFHLRSKQREYCRAISKALNAGAEKLKAGQSAREAVVAAVKTLEAEPCTNAGLGSNLTLQGRFEGDASVMDSAGNFGAVGALPGVAHPIVVAEAIASESQKPLSLGRVRPLMLAGDAARQWAAARQCGGAVIDADAASGINVTASALQQWKRYSAMIAEAEGAAELQPSSSREELTAEGNSGEVYDTVGAVCVTSSGETAAAVSSGGIAMKTPGRVGEAALHGSGCWAEASRVNTTRNGNQCPELDASSESEKGAPSQPSSGFACSVTGVGERKRNMPWLVCALRESGSMQGVRLGTSAARPSAGFKTNHFPIQLE
eukprot:CAMPEP_0177581808 /NCGR_PEP_ID=MMETSP0419_2-20121207/2359_1 /TAXON_ID=582737 /ORGANISM="Tetraselmis sp., Strain GSL018" /LENGTH=337 /DNA_ID=CAMNT_0019070903 /DNA_START=98 /DNA_END=1112 /DNA_ORIENTATION=-